MLLNRQATRMYVQGEDGYDLYERERTDWDGYATFRWKTIVKTKEEADRWITIHIRKE